MGQEITRVQFCPDDFENFSRRLTQETALLREMMRSGVFSESKTCMAGVEIEAWLLDTHCFPVADNERVLKKLANPLVVPELSRFNIEINCSPHPLKGKVFSTLHRCLANTWQQCRQVAREFDHDLLLIGTLPTLRERDLCLANLSPLNRYYALNDQVMQARGGHPFRLNITGKDHLQCEHGDVMLEAGTTSFQLHLQVPLTQMVRYYNAAQLLAAPIVAVSANAPFLFRHDLWAETRIPLFEQAVDLSSGDPQLARVTFGRNWLQDSPFEQFAENLEHYPPLLPFVTEEPPTSLAHVRLHNGTIWRWNRLLVGGGGHGEPPHVRLEHRVMAAGPTFIDMLANAALFYGAVHFLAGSPKSPESQLPFAAARANFYHAAKNSLEAELIGLEGQRQSLRQWLLETLLPMAREGLQWLDIDVHDTEPLLDIIRCRIETGQTGAAWQRRYIAENPHDFVGLTANYLEHQRQGNPVHEWGVP